MRSLFVLLALLALCAVASAGNRVVVLTDRGDLPSALQLALAQRAEVTMQPGAPSGDAVLDRAAAAQRAAVSTNANAGVWIDGDDIWVVSADGREVRHAPLSGDASPRAFAAIAASLLDELLAPPENAAHIGVDVHVDITPPSAAVTVAPPVITAAPAIVTPAVVATATAAPVRPSALIEIGATATTATAGLEAEVLFPIAREHSLALGVIAGVNEGFRDSNFFESGESMFDALLELRHVGSGTTHFDYGFAAGVGNAGDGGEGALALLRVGVTHSLDTYAVGFSLAPTMLIGFNAANPLMTLTASLHLDLGI
ncbi:MAG TPA: hypothetical protein VGG74_07760 [Kofleriaceae bacterium]|jgi:hypothetical protein